MAAKIVLNTMPQKRHFDFGFIPNSACCDKRVAWELWDKIRLRVLHLHLLININ
jgi:hypothetical protein